MFPTKADSVPRLDLRVRASRNNSLDNTIISEDLDELFQSRRSTLYVIPSIDREVMITAQNLPGCCIAGGAALGLYTGEITQIKDWDLFFTDWAAHSAAAHAFKSLGFKLLKEQTEWSHSLTKSGVIVQLIHYRFCDSVENIFEQFDFSVCCFALDGPFMRYTKQAVTDVSEGKINLVYADNLTATIKRIARYGKKGFVPTTECVHEIIRLSTKEDQDNLSSSNGCS